MLIRYDKEHMNQKLSHVYIVWILSHSINQTQKKIYEKKFNLNI